MGWEAWFTAAVLVVVLLLLLRERVPAPFAVVGGVVAFVLTGVLTPAQAFAGFSSEAPITIAGLFILSAAAKATGALDVFVTASIGRPLERMSRPRRRELMRILVPSSVMSAFIYNTPTIGLLAPQVAAWAKRAGRPPSWYLLPLNHVVLLGGVVTAVGTTTNAVVSGLMVEEGMRPLGMFELTTIGLPLLLAGGVVLVALAPLLLPDRTATSDELEQDLRDVTLHMVVDPAGPLVGRTVAQAGLRNLQGTFLAHLLREGEAVAPVGPHEVLRADDQLTFVGNLSRAVDVSRHTGLLPVDAEETDGPFGGGTFYEAVLSQGSPLVGRTPKEADFRAQFDSAVVAIHRDGERLTGKLGDIRLRGGDVLLLLGGPDGAKLQRGRGDFLVVAPVEVDPPVRREQSRLVLLVLGLFLVAVVSGLVDVLHASLAAAVAVLVLRILSPAQARSALDVDVLVTLCASFGLGAAVDRSGLAGHVADGLVAAFSWAGDTGVLLAVLLATVVLTQVVTNNAVAVVMFPVALAAASAAGQPPRPFVLAVVIGASLSFLTTFGYQTNLVVAGLANYRSRDFVPLGALLLVTTVAVTAAVLAPRLG